jgi:hypothetical protein
MRTVFEEMGPSHLPICNLNDVLVAFISVSLDLIVLVFAVRFPLFRAVVRSMSQSLRCYRFRTSLRNHRAGNVLRHYSRDFSDWRGFPRSRAKTANDRRRHPFDFGTVPVSEPTENGTPCAEARLEPPSTIEVK